MVRRGEKRSASAPPTTMSTALGNAWTTKTVPRARLEPVSCRTSHAMAMKLKKSPNSDSVVATQSLRNGPDARTVHRRGRSVASIGEGTSSSIACVWLTTPAMCLADLAARRAGRVDPVRQAAQVSRQQPGARVRVAGDGASLVHAGALLGQHPREVFRAGFHRDHLAPPHPYLSTRASAS